MRRSGVGAADLIHANPGKIHGLPNGGGIHGVDACRSMAIQFEPEKPLKVLPKNQAPLVTYSADPAIFHEPRLALEMKAA
jgi:hypothetical protein